MAETKYIGSLSRASLLVMEHALFLQARSLEYIAQMFETEVPEPFNIETADTVSLARAIIDAEADGSREILERTIAEQMLAMQQEQAPPAEEPPMPPMTPPTEVQ